MDEATAAPNLGADEPTHTEFQGAEQPDVKPDDPRHAQPETPQEPDR